LFQHAFYRRILADFASPCNSSLPATLMT